MEAKTQDVLCFVRRLLRPRRSVLTFDLTETTPVPGNGLRPKHRPRAREATDLQAEDAAGCLTLSSRGPSRHRRPSRSPTSRRLCPGDLRRGFGFQQTGRGGEGARIDQSVLPDGRFRLWARAGGPSCLGSSQHPGGISPEAPQPPCPPFLLPVRPVHRPL